MLVIFWGYPHKFCSLNDLKEAIRIEAAVIGRDMLVKVMVMDNFEEQFLMCLQKDKCHFLEVFFFCKWKIFVFNILNYMFLKWHELQNVFVLIKTCVFGNLRSCSILKTNHRFCATPELFSDISGNGCLRDWGINTMSNTFFKPLVFCLCCWTNWHFTQKPAILQRMYKNYLF